MATGEYRVRMMPLAADDLESVYDYIAKTLHAEQAAHNLMRDIEDAITRLADFPLSAPKCLDETLSMKGYRKLVVHNYLILYLVDQTNQEVLIMRVMYGRRQYEQLI